MTDKEEKPLSEYLSAPCPETGAVTLTLEHPYSFGSEEVSEITIQRLKGIHFKGLNPKKIEESADDMMLLLSRAVGKTPKFIHEMDFADFQRAMEAIQDFL